MIFDLTADSADEVRWLALHGKEVVSLIPQPFQMECGYSPCGRLASALTQTKAMNISMTDNPEVNEHQWFLVFLCGCCISVSNPAWDRLQQPSAHFHSLACATK